MLSAVPDLFTPGYARDFPATEGALRTRGVVRPSTHSRSCAKKRAPPWRSISARRIRRCCAASSVAESASARPRSSRPRPNDLGERCAAVRAGSARARGRPLARAVGHRRRAHPAGNPLSHLARPRARRAAGQAARFPFAGDGARDKYDRSEIAGLPRSPTRWSSSRRKSRECASRCKMSSEPDSGLPAAHSFVALRGGQDDAEDAHPDREPPRARFSVSHTTRKPRANEIDGREYHFVDRATFVAMDPARRVRGVGRGARQPLRHQPSRDRAREGDAPRRGLRHRLPGRAADQGQGARRGRGLHSASVDEELERRLRSRASDDEETVQRRLQTRDPRSSTMRSSTTSSSTTTSSRRTDSSTPSCWPNERAACAARARPNDSSASGKALMPTSRGHRRQRALRAFRAGRDRSASSVDTPYGAPSDASFADGWETPRCSSCRATAAGTVSSELHQLPREHLRA